VKILLLIAVFSALLFASLPSKASAFDIYNTRQQGVDCSKDQNKESAVCVSKTDKDPLTGTNGLLVRITYIVSFVAGAAAVIVIIVGSIKYITSGGDSNRVNSARNTILYALVGLVIIILAPTLIVYLVSKL
jgi:hypothetical protein